MVASDDEARAVLPVDKFCQSRGGAWVVLSEGVCSDGQEPIVMELGLERHSGGAGFGRGWDSRGRGQTGFCSEVTGRELKLLRSGIGVSFLSSNTGWLRFVSNWHCCLCRLSFLTLELLMMIVSTSVFIRLRLPVSSVTLVDVVGNGGFGDNVTVMGCFLLAPVGQGALLTMTKIMRLMLRG